MIRELILWQLCAAGMGMTFLFGLVLGVRSDVVKCICGLGIVLLSAMIFFIL